VERLTKTEATTINPYKDRHPNSEAVQKVLRWLMTLPDPEEEAKGAQA
jgi:hypothetical protein